jgi:cbb3-type cytochrome oxidase subunit 3
LFSVPSRNGCEKMKRYSIWLLVLFIFMAGCTKSNLNQEPKESMDESQGEQLEQEYQALIGTWKRINLENEVFCLSKIDNILYISYNQGELSPLALISKEKRKNGNYYCFINEEKKKGYNFFLKNEETMTVNSFTSVEGVDSISPPLEYRKTDEK